MRVVIVGGSMGGLTAALELRDAGCEVLVLEQRRQPLDGRGAGIILQPETARAVCKRDPSALEAITTECRWLRQLEGTAASANPDALHFESAEPWAAVSWTGLYHRLREQWGERDYRLGWPVERLTATPDGVQVEGPAGAEHADLVVLADGVSSRLHHDMGATLTVEASGYVGWRGTADLVDMSPSAAALLDESITYAGTGEGHIVMYPIDVPGAGRRLNYVWYRPLPEDSADLLTDSDGVLQERSLAPGKVADRHVEELRETAARQLPPALSEVIQRTAEPFLQVIVDQRADRMISTDGRMLVLGDAAFAARPHAAAGTAKALEDAMELGTAMARADLRDQASVRRELTRWARERMAVGTDLVNRAAAMGRTANAPGFSLSDPTFRFGLHAPT